MYKIQNETNRIVKLQEMSFSDLGFSERNHLQEWLANQPDALGEKLLVIQKEFDGFQETRERLDLLAIDAAGKLVIIENKLDDSGRDVVWQAIKYASYCSTLSKTEVADSFQAYLNKEMPGQDARALICEFLGKDDFDDVVINAGDDQRIILVAANFRKEVTSTVLWLTKRGVSMKCFRATPYSDGVQTFLDLEQILPVPEIENFMIKVAKKEVEQQQSAERGQAKRQIMMTEFWRVALEALGAAGLSLFAKVRPSKDQFLTTGAKITGVAYFMFFTSKSIRVGLGLGTSSVEANKAMFDYLWARKSSIEGTFGAEFIWQRDLKQPIIKFETPFDGLDRGQWPAMGEWLAEHIGKLERAFSNEIPALRQFVNPQGQ
ncbi:DUF4268 domain-containing protein [Paraburkholderia sp. RCC_158]|uniref:DUF4268 domain-containing protein n=1 Tax=Paraburkholderia sp. RCC_158 TaxID=3239220 RepID=UPI003525D5CE